MLLIACFWIIFTVVVVTILGGVVELALTAPWWATVGMIGFIGVVATMLIAVIVSDR